MKITQRGVIDFINVASEYLAVNKDATKLAYALNRVLKRAAKIHSKYAERREDLQIDNCLVDEKSKKVLRNAQGGYEFTREGLQKFNEECRAALDDEVEIEPFIATDLPGIDKTCPHCQKTVEKVDDLAPTYRDAFIGFVIAGERED